MKSQDQEGDVWHLVVFIGMSGKKADDAGYPSAWSFLEEVRLFGASRKIPRTIIESDKFKNLGPRSRLVFVHPRALPIFNYTLNRGSDNRPFSRCKKFQEWVEQKEKWQAVRTGYHRDMITVHKPNQLNIEERCTFALRDLACLCHSNTTYNGQNEFFQIEMPSFSFTGVTPKNPTEIMDHKTAWLSGAFLSGNTVAAP